MVPAVGERRAGSAKRTGTGTEGWIGETDGDGDGNGN